MLLGDGAVARVEVGLVEEKVVDVEAPRETDLVILQDGPRFSMCARIHSFRISAFTEEGKKFGKYSKATPAWSCLLLLSNSRLKVPATTYQPLFPSLYRQLKGFESKTALI